LARDFLSPVVKNALLIVDMNYWEVIFINPLSGFIYEKEGGRKRERERERERQVPAAAFH